MKLRGWAVVVGSLACAATVAVWHDVAPRRLPIASEGAARISGPQDRTADAPRVRAPVAVDRAAVRGTANPAVLGPVRPLLTLAGSEPPRRDGVFSLYPVRIDEKQAVEAMSSGRLSIPMPDGSPLDLAFEHAIDHGDGNWSWIGTADGGSGTQRAVITFGPDGVAATLPDNDGRQVKLTLQGGQTYLATAPLSSLRVGVNPLGDGITPPVLPSGAKVSTGAFTQALQPLAGVDMQSVAQGAQEAVGGQATVDVLVLYSDGFRLAKGSPSAAVTELTNRFDVANQVLRNSQLPATFRMVHAQEAESADDTDNGALLEAIRGNTPWIQDMRDQYGADLVTFVREYNAANNSCGVAYIPPGDYAADGDLMYSVVSDGSLPDGYYCEATTLAHELGHNLGAQHNHEQDATGALFPYAYGYRNFSAQFYDVMAYGPDPEQRFWTFSNPDTQCKGLPCGVVDYADVSKALRQTLPVAAGFRPTKIAKSP